VPRRTSANCVRAASSRPFSSRGSSDTLSLEIRGSVRDATTGTSSAAPTRIHILGSPVSGNPFLARRLSRGLGIPRYGLDDSVAGNEGDDSVAADTPKRDQALAEIVAQPAWTLEGVYHAWLEPSFARADCTVVLDPPLWLRQWRGARRSAHTLLTDSISKVDGLHSTWARLRYGHRYDSSQLFDALDALAPHARKLLIVPDADSALPQIRRATPTPTHD
jgi:adenylate kinase family enzyme